MKSVTHETSTINGFVEIDFYIRILFYTELAYFSKLLFCILLMSLSYFELLCDHLSNSQYSVTYVLYISLRISAVVLL